MFCSCSCSGCTTPEFFNSTSNRKDVAKMNTEVPSASLEYDTLTIEQEWRNAITSSDNKKIKHLFKEHHKRIKFLKIKFEDGDNSLHRAIQTRNLLLAKFLLILKMNVCICAVYILINLISYIVIILY